MSATLSLTARAACSCGLGLFWALGYFSTGIRSGMPAFDPSTVLDLAIPFLGWSVWVYLAGIVWIALPALLLRPTHFRRAALAYALAIAVSLLCFALLPSAAPSLRAQALIATEPAATAWAFGVLHHIDRPTNLLPSLHVSLSMLASLLLAHQYPAWRMACWAALAAVGASVCLTKQHALTDAAAGLVTGAASYTLVARLMVARHTCWPLA